MLEMILIVCAVFLLLIAIYSGSFFASSIAIILIISLFVAYTLIKGKEQEELRKAQIAKNKEKVNSSIAYTFNFESGLPIPQYAAVEIHVCENQLKFLNLAANKWFSLDYSKIQSIQSLLRSEPVPNDKSVVKSGIVGGLIAGEVGAIIGTASAQKTKQITRCYIVIFYESDNEAKMIQFSTTTNFQGTADYLVDTVRKRLPNLGREVKL